MKVVPFLLIQVVLIGTQFGIYGLTTSKLTEMKIATLEKRYSDVVWEVDQAAIQKTEENNENYLSTKKNDIYTFWHSEDRDLRFTIESPAMKLLLREKYLIVKEGMDGEHLALTIYFNPLKTTDAEPKDLLPIYQMIKYKKPSIMLEIEKEKEMLEDDNADVSCIDKDKQLFEPNYPFEESDVLKELDEFIVYAKNLMTPNMLNGDFLRLYVKEDSIKGYYGWEAGVLPEEEIEEK